MRKYFLALLTVTLFMWSCTSTSGKYDKKAIEHFDKLSETIGQLNSCSYTLNSASTIGNITEFSNESDVYFRGPNKMYINIVGTKGTKGFWYNGTRFAYYAYDKHIFDTIAAADNIIAVIDQLHNEYGIDFPAADFFYPTFTDDVIDNFNEVLNIGVKEHNGVECVVVEAINNEKTMQIWIDKNTNLPHMMTVVKSDNIGDSYEAVFSNWRINPQLPDLLFEFMPPSNSTRVKLQSKK